MFPKKKSYGLFLILLAGYMTTYGQISFDEVARDAGLASTGFHYGASFGDYDNDGDEDLFISRINGYNLLYKNLGNGLFDEVGEETGVDFNGTTYMGVWGDVDNDGDLDLYIGTERYEENALYRNNGDGTFTDITETAGVGNRSKTRSVLMVDADNDGHLDIYLANHNAENAFFHNNGDGTFTDIVEESGTTDMLIAMGSMFFDMDNDGDQDLYLTHDNYQANILYRNDGNNKFTDVSEEAGVAYEGLGMGVDAGDFNNDGFLDLYITNMLENVLYKNNGDGTFTDITESAGVGDDGMGWGLTWLDYNNDGQLDIYLVNDSEFFPNPNILYRNNGDETFTEVSEETDLSSEFEGYSSACADLNYDGHPDIFVTNNEVNNQLFLNNNYGSNWIMLKLEGTTSNRSAIGTRVEAHINGKRLLDEINAGSGYSAQNSMTLHFGIGQASMVDSLLIRWPSGIVQKFIEVEGNVMYELTEGDELEIFEQPNLSCGFDEIFNELHGSPGYSHGIAFGDYDNDGDDDIYVSRRKDEPNELFENLGGGQFINVAEEAGVAFGNATRTSVWGDFNNDGRLDLYLGNEGEDVIYINDGDKTFTDITLNSGIRNRYHPNSVNLADIDLDGDLDIYVANITSQNIMWRNNGDLTFSNITTLSGTPDTRIAMGAIFFDYDEDGDPDLYLTHDGYRTNILYENDGTGKFTDKAVETGLDLESQGMGVDVGDYNNDGHLDIYITNLNENTLFLNNANGSFSDVSGGSGIEDLGMGWGTLWLDFDNDGWQDLYVANNSYYSPLSNVLYQNNTDYSFSQLCADAAISSMNGAYGTASSDVNGDGLVDLFIANEGVDGNELFLNKFSGFNWIGFKTLGTISNRFGIGTRLVIEYNGITTVDEVNAGAGFASQNSLAIHFGLKNELSIDKLTIYWPSGLVETYTDLPANEIYTLVEDEGIKDSDFKPNQVVTSIEAEEHVVQQLSAFPNPTSGKINFQYVLKSADVIKLEVYDMQGNKVVTLVDSFMPAGEYVSEWNPIAKSKGIYIYSLSTGSGTFRGKVIRN